MLDVEEIRAFERHHRQQAKLLAGLGLTLDWYHHTLAQLIAELEETRERLVQERLQRGVKLTYAGLDAGK